MFGQRQSERHRRGKQALLEKLVDEIGPECGGCARDRLRTALGVILQKAMYLSLFRRVVDLQRQQLALRVDRIAVLVHEVRLQPPDHHPMQLLLVWHDSASEPLIIEQFEQRGEGLLIAVVRRSGQEEPMFEVRSERSDQTSALTRHRVSAGGRRCDIVGFIDDQDVELARIGDMRRQGVLDESKTLAALHPVHGSDQTRKTGPRIRMDAALPSKAFHVVGVHDSEFEAELLVHLGLPFHLKRSRTDDEHGTGAMPYQEFLYYEPGFDGLAESHIVGDE